MKSHEQYAALLDAFIDGALPEAEAAQVRAHLADCAECQAYVTDALTMRELFPGIEETPVPDGFAETVLSGLPPQNSRTEAQSNLRRTQAQSGSRRAQAQSVQWRRQWTKIALPLAACVTLALLVGGIWRGLPTGGGAAGTSASGNVIMTENATVTAAANDTDMTQAAGVTAAGYDMDMDEAAPETNEVMTESAPEFDEVTAGSAADMDGGAVYSAQSAATERSMNGGAMPESAAEADDAESESGAGEAVLQSGSSASGAASKKSFAPRETPENEESALFDFGMTAPTLYDYSAPSPETPMLGAAYSADAMPPQNATADSGEPQNGAADSADTMPPQTVETDEAPPQSAETESAQLSDAAPIPESVTVSYWTISPDAAPKLERYPVSKETDSGVWYALDPEQFDALRESLPESAFTPMDADSLSGNPPPARDRASVYLFLPFS